VAGECPRPVEKLDVLRLCVMCVQAAMQLVLDYLGVVNEVLRPR